MAITHTAPPIGKNTDRLKQAEKASRKPGVSPKFIQSIMSNAEVQSNDSKSSAS